MLDNAEAYCRMAECHEEGTGASVSLDDAIHYYELAAELGSVRAEGKLRAIGRSVA